MPRRLRHKMRWEAAVLDVQTRRVRGVSFILAKLRAYSTGKKTVAQQSDHPQTDHPQSDQGTSGNVDQAIGKALS